MVMQSFVPDPCAALAIQACIALKACKLADIDVGSLSKGFTTLVTAASDLDTTLSDSNVGVDTLLLAAVTAAFSAASETLPTLPPPPSVPDMVGCATTASNFESVVSQLIDPLGALGGVISITFDGNGLPTLIEWDDGL